MDDTGTTHSLPGGGSVTMIGGIAIESDGPDQRAVCRECGHELARWRTGESAPRLRCSACRPARR